MARSQDCGQRVGGFSGDVQDRLPAIEPVHQEQIDGGLGELTGSGRLGRVNRQHPIAGVGVVGDVERSVTGRHDRRVVDHGRTGQADERAVPRAADRAGLHRLGRQSGGAWYEDPSRREVRRAGKVHRCLAELQVPW